MDLKYLNTFRNIVRRASFSRAAERLNYTQSTITFQMGQLEGEPPPSCLKRWGGWMVLSQAGQRLLPYVDQVLDAVDQMRFFPGGPGPVPGGHYHRSGGDLAVLPPAPGAEGLFTGRSWARLFIQSMNCYDIRDGLLAGALTGIFTRTLGAGGPADHLPPGAVPCGPGGRPWGAGPLPGLYCPPASACRCPC